MDHLTFDTFRDTPIDQLVSQDYAFALSFDQVFSQMKTLEAQPASQRQVTSGHSTGHLPQITQGAAQSRPVASTQPPVSGTPVPQPHPLA